MIEQLQVNQVNIIDNKTSKVARIIYKKVTPLTTRSKNNAIRADKKIYWNINRQNKIEVNKESK
jgi:hypothetical protein